MMSALYFLSLKIDNHRPAVTCLMQIKTKIIYMERTTKVAKTSQHVRALVDAEL